METYLLTLLGILVSVVLFLLGYRKTFGARKERVKIANGELEKVLLKRVVLESYQPTIEELSRLVNGKARDHQVKPRDLLSEVQLLETVFTRIIESDFITPDQRSEIVERLSPVLVKAEQAPVEEILVAELPSLRKQVYSRTVIPLIMGILASIVGALVTVLSNFPDTIKLAPEPWFTTFVASFAVITLVFLIYRLRESQEEISSKNALQSAIDFQQEVGRVLKRTRARSELAGPDSGFDFMVTMGEKKILIDVKAWSRRAPISIIRNLVARLSEAIKAHGANEGIIITKAPVELPPNSLKNTRVRIMSLRELRNYIAHGRM